MAYDNDYGYAQNGYTQYFDMDGKPLTGGTLSTFIAGTTTPIVTYKDFNGEQNPAVIPLDENGGATVILKQDIVYKFIIRDKNGDIFKTIDNIVTGGTTTVVEVDAQIPIASASELGGIKVGKNLTIEPDGTLNAQTGGDGITTTVSEITEDTTVTLVAGQNRYLNCTNSPTILVEIADNNVYHLQINGSCTINLTGVSWSGDEITDITTKAEISILNGIAVGVIYE